METLLLSKILGILLFVLGIGVFVNFRYFMDVIEDIAAHPSLILFISLLRLIIGSVIVVFHSVRSGGIGVLITVLGWIILLAGISGMIFPHKLVKMVPVVTKHPDWLSASAVVFAVLGGLLLYVGFFG